MKRYDWYVHVWELKTKAGNKSIDGIHVLVTRAGATTLSPSLSSLDDSLRGNTNIDFAVQAVKTFRSVKEQKTASKLPHTAVACCLS